jgi:hypothetical protein
MIISLIACDRLVEVVLRLRFDNQAGIAVPAFVVCIQVNPIAQSLCNLSAAKFLRSRRELINHGDNA